MHDIALLKTVLIRLLTMTGGKIVTVPYMGNIVVSKDLDVKVRIPALSAHLIWSQTSCYLRGMMSVAKQVIPLDMLIGSSRFPSQV